MDGQTQAFSQRTASERRTARVLGHGELTKKITKSIDLTAAGGTSETGSTSHAQVEELAQRQELCSRGRKGTGSVCGDHKSLYGGTTTYMSIGPLGVK